MPRRGAIVLTSGGADSTPLLYYVVKVLRPEDTLAIWVDYGQRMAEMERLGVEKNVEYLRQQGYNVSLKTVEVRWLGELSTSKLVSDEPLPETPVELLEDPNAARERILWWWDVVRNLQLVTIGLAHAESIDLRSYLKTGRRCVYDVYIGIRLETPVPMKDNTPEFVEEMNRVAEVATHFGGYRVYAPFINLPKPAVVRLGEALGVRWAYTFSCYTNVGRWVRHPVYEDEVLLHCGYCSNCRRRALAFKEAGVPDPTLYHKRPLADVDYEAMPSGAYIEKRALTKGLAKTQG